MDLGSSSADGLGLTGVSFNESFVPGLANPAQWGQSVLAQGTAGATLQSFDARDNFGSSQNTVFTVNNFQLLLPLKKSKFGISVSLAPLTRSNFRVVQTTDFIQGSGAQADTVSFRSENRGDGGVNNLELGFGWRINSNISIGYAASLVFASVDNKVTTFFAQQGFQPVQFTLETSGLGFGNRFGTFFTFPGLFKENDMLSLGATLRLPVIFDAKRTQESDKQLGPTSVETVIIEDGPGLGSGDIELPMSLNAGATYHFSNKVSLSAEGLYEPWSDYASELDPQQQALMSDRYKMGVGVRFFPYIMNSDKFLSKFKYRFGVSYDSGHLELQNRNIETLMLNFGLGILSPNSRSSVDINVQYGFRGTTADNLVKENIWGVRLSLNLAELMFFRPKLQ
ncbi:MAG: hypothetical protein R3211_05970 [Balneolaceae bacterium]|nr:hypothetical protein [Balneolaceae bacterium]